MLSSTDPSLIIDKDVVSLGLVASRKTVKFPGMDMRYGESSVSRVVGG